MFNTAYPECLLSNMNSQNIHSLKQILQTFPFRHFMLAFSWSLYPLQVFSMFLETLVDFIIIHKDDLQDWLFVLLTQLLKKMGADLLGSVQAKVQKALDVTRYCGAANNIYVSFFSVHIFLLFCYFFRHIWYVSREKHLLFVNFWGILSFKTTVDLLCLTYPEHCLIFYKLR